VNLRDAVKKIYVKEGPAAFFRGLFPSFIGVVPYKGSGFFMFHFLRDKMKENYPHITKPKTFDFIFGAIAGLTAQVGKEK